MSPGRRLFDVAQESLDSLVHPKMHVLDRGEKK